MTNKIFLINRTNYLIYGEIFKIIFIYTEKEQYYFLYVGVIAISLYNFMDFCITRV